MLTNKEKRNIEHEMIRIIYNYNKGINTRSLISLAYKNLHSSIPNANRHHFSGMIAWLLKAYNFHLIIRTPGYSVIQ